MKLKLIFLMVFVLVSLSISSVCAEDADNATIQVTEQIMSVNDVIGEDLIVNNIADESTGSFTELQDLIDNNNVVNLTKNYTAIGSEGRIHIKSDKIINGNGYTLNANKKTGILEIKGGNIVFNDMVFTNGKDNYGGAIYVSNYGSLTFNNVIFTNNYAENNGGAICDMSRNLNSVSYVNCTFNNNMAENFGGAIYSDLMLQTNYCTFKDNCADKEGGALYAYFPRIYNSLFESNKVEDGGGAIRAVNDVKLENDVFTRNTAKIGGAIYTSTLISDNSTFKDNCADNGGAIYATAIFINILKPEFKSFFINNIANNDNGGAIYAEDSVESVDSIFSGNSAYVGGGAIYAQRNVTIENSTFDNNKASGAVTSQCYGGAINAKGDVKVDKSTFSNNYAADYGGAIYANSVNIISASSFINNKVDDNDGGAIYAENYVKSVDSIFTGNSAYVDGGAIYAKGNVELKNSTFENNKADGASASQCYGGAIRSKSDVKVDNCSFLNNHAADYGGAIYADTITWVNTTSYFIGNYVDDNCGGAIYTNKFTTDIFYGVFINNTAKANDDGGAIYINNENHLTIAQCYFENNRCGDEGGAIYTDSKSSRLKLLNNIFIDNDAGDKGDIVYNSGEYDAIGFNWFGTNKPNFDNKFKEYHTFWPDDDCSDTFPVHAKLLLDKDCKVGKEYNLTVYFEDAKGNDAILLCDLIKISISADNNAKISDWHKVTECKYVTGITFNNTNVTHITANVNHQVLELDVLPTVDDSQYRQENASNSEDVVTNDEELFALPNEVYELPRSLLNEPSEGLIDTPNDDVPFSLLNKIYEGLIDSTKDLSNALNDSYNTPVNNDYNIGMDSNNGNTNLLGINSNVENTNHTNSSNKTPNNSSVAKNIGNQSNGSGFNYLWVLLLIVIFAGAGVLIKQYKN